MNPVKLLQRHSDYIELIQITDTHLFSRPETTFDGIDTAQSLQQVLDHARQTHWPPDAILVTGDLVHDPEAKAYERLLKILKTTDKSTFCIPGNHDDPALMHQHLNQANVSTTKIIQFNRWAVIMLDTWLPGTHAGALSADELTFLDQQLKANHDKHILLCLHHSPVSVNSPWMDKMPLQNPAELFAIIDHYPHVKAILWGHVHHEFSTLHNNVQLMAAPSTCVQFAPKAERYTKDDLTAGYRYLKLYNDGRIDTEIVRIA